MKSRDTRVKLTISGFVQGVFFRATARDVARQYGLRGWVRNTYSGKVEVVAEGPIDKVQDFIDWCHEGPRHAAVKDVSVEWGEATGEFKEFGVRP